MRIVTFWLLVLCPAALLASRLSVAADVPPVPLMVKDAGSLSAALLKGGTIQLAPGTYTGSFLVSNDGTELRGVQPISGRVTPGQTAAVIITAADALKPAIKVAASHVTLAGVTIQAVATDRAAVLVGSPGATDPGEQPDDVTFDGIEVLAAANGGRRGIEAHTRGFTLTHSRVIGFVYQGADAQAFYAANGPGPYNLIDNELQGSGENVMFGGGAIKSPAMVPSNIVLRHNLLLKPQDWRQRKGSVKNSLEFKAGKGAVVEDNVIDGCWRDAQAGHMIVLTPRNQDKKSPWVEVSDIVLRGNRTVNHTDGYAVNILGTDNEAPSQQTARITIEGNLFQDSPNGVLINRGVAESLKLVANTFPATRGSLLQFAGRAAPGTPLVVERLVAKSGDYGISGDGTKVGVPTLAAYTASLQWTGNVIEKTAARSIEWPRGTTLLAPGGLASLLDAEFHYVRGHAGW